MIDIIIAALLSVRNAEIAGRKGYSKWGYGLITFFGFIFAECICVLLLVAYKYEGAFDVTALAKFLTEDISRGLLIMLCGMGIYLLVRFILEKMPDKNIKDKKDKDWLKTLGR